MYIVIKSGRETNLQSTHKSNSPTIAHYNPTPGIPTRMTIYKLKLEMLRGSMHFHLVSRVLWDVLLRFCCGCSIRWRYVIA